MSLAFVLECYDEHPQAPESETDALERSGRRLHAEPTADSAAPASVSTRILIVEDDWAVRATTREVLETQGYSVFEASGADEGLRVLEAQPVDVLVLDLFMPGHDGLWLLDRIDPPPPVVIVVSAFEYVTEASVRSRAGSKISRLIKKPASPAMLLENVISALDEWRASQ